MIFDEKAIKQIVADALPKQGVPELSEAYVAQQKQYELVTDKLSSKTKNAHLAMYKRLVEQLSKASMRSDAADKLEVNPCMSAYRDAKVSEMTLHNDVYLHELYFANCFDPSSEIFMDTLAYMRLQRDFGTFEAWQLDFLANAQASQNGWVACGFSTFLKRYVNVALDSSVGGGLVGFFPIVVIDLAEHAYYADYPGDVKGYAVAMMQEINWDVVEARVQRAEAINEALK